jgi:hypothetical protein
LAAYSNDGTGWKDSAGRLEDSAPVVGWSTGAGFVRATGSGPGAELGRAIGSGTTLAEADSAATAGRGRGSGVRGGVRAAERAGGGLDVAGGSPGSNLDSGGAAP